MGKTVTLPSGKLVPALGLGTWHMGERSANREAEVSALKAGIEAGLTLVDTAEMYANGGAEEVTAEAIKGQRDAIYLVSKVLPQNASLKCTVSACERSLKRLKTDQIDLYLLHWQGSHPVAETVEAFERLKADGKIADWGVSNFDSDAMAGIRRVSAGNHCAANQVLYHLGSRGIEWQLLPECQKAGIAIMAYCPLGQGSLLDDPAILSIARKHGVPSSATALAFILSKPGVISIPKSARAERAREFAKALDVVLDEEDLLAFDRAYPAPKRKMTLDIN